MSTVAAKNAFVDILGALSGVRKATDNPPDSLNVFPFAVAWVDEYQYEKKRLGNLFSNGTFVLVGQIHVARKDQARALATLEVYPDLIRTALVADPTLNGTVNNILEYKPSGPIPGVWDSQNTLYIEFRVTVDIKYC